MAQGPGEAEFESFFEEHHARLRVALVVGLGRDRGAEATAEAWAWAYENWSRLTAIQYPVPYLYRVGASRTRRRRRRILVERPAVQHLEVEPGLRAALAALTEQQRIAVILRGAYGWHLTEVAELMGISSSTVNVHAQRGLERLKEELGVHDG